MNIFRTLLIFGILQINSCQIDNNYGNVIRQALESALQFQSSPGVLVENLNFGNVQNIIMNGANELLPSILDSMGGNITSSCLDDLKAFLQAVLRRDDWALRSKFYCFDNHTCYRYLDLSSLPLQFQSDLCS
jgi:hypothetical protein